MTTVEDALKHEAALLERALAERPEYQRLQIIRKTLAELQGIKVGGGAVTSAAGIATGVATVKAAGRTIAASIPVAAKLALEEAGRPMLTREILAAIPKFGKTVTGKNPAINLSNNLSSSPLVSSILWRGDTVWWIAGREPPPE